MFDLYVVLYTYIPEVSVKIYWAKKLKKLWFRLRKKSNDCHEKVSIILPHLLSSNNFIIIKDNNSGKCLG